MSNVRPLVQMPSGFSAVDLSIDEHDGVLITTLSAPSTEDEDFYLMLQHKDMHDEQDVRFGMDRPYIEYCGRGQSWYGHIKRVELQRDRLVVQLDQAAASHMRGDGHIEVGFSLGDTDFCGLRQALRRTFNGRPYFSEVV